ncbi:MAG: type II toxin-antitoxin system VapC family toxin [Legionellales bacterium]|nr:type II toxin-antitoxin system VapC family toxin [Legionellales bacterium]
MRGYIDSSVILRIIFGEADPIQFAKNLESFFASEILKIECFRTIDRMHRSLHLSDKDIAERYGALHAILKTIHFIKFSGIICQKASEPFPIVLKTLDAIHLASAILWQQQEEKECLFLTHDHQLAKAATTVGFNVLGV